MQQGSYHPNSVRAPKRTSNTSNYSSPSQPTVMMTKGTNSSLQSSSSGGADIGSAGMLLAQVGSGLAAMGPAGWTILGVGVVAIVAVVAVDEYQKRSHG